MVFVQHFLLFVRCVFSKTLLYLHIKIVEVLHKQTHVRTRSRIKAQVEEGSTINNIFETSFRTAYLKLMLAHSVVAITIIYM